jgi:hypothetical protein
MKFSFKNSFSYVNELEKIKHGEKLPRADISLFPQTYVPNRLGINAAHKNL